MPKQKSKRKKGVGIDFQKARHKVGKKIPQASNATRISFKTKGIVLPEQSIGVDKEGVAVNQRNLTLKETLNQTSHYNAKVRKDAMFGLRTIIKENPKELSRNTASIFENLSPRIADMDKGVREALKLLLKEAILPQIPETQLSPFAPLLLVHVCSAMTNLSASVRATAVSFLEILVDSCPSVIGADFAPQIFSHFSVLLSRTGPHSQPIKSLPPVIACFLKVLASVSPQQPADLSQHNRATSAVHEYSWGQKRDPKSVRKTLHSYNSNRRATSGKLLSFPALPLQENNGSRDLAAVGPGQEGFVPALSDSFVPLLLDTVREAAPSLVPSPEAAALKCLVLCARALLSFSARAPLSKNAGAVVLRLQPLFPLRAPPGAVPAAVLTDLASANVGMCRVLARLAGPVDESNSWQGTVLSFLEGALSDGIVLPTHGISSHVSAETQRQLADPHMCHLAADVADVIPSLRAAPQRQLALLRALTKLWERARPSVRLKLTCLHSLRTLVTAQHVSEYPGTPGDPSQAIRDHLRDWVSSLPRHLWEIKGKQPSVTEAILWLLLDLSRSPSWSPGDLQTSMVPFFCVPHPRGAASGTLFGPFVHLPEPCQALALSLLAHQKKTLSRAALAALSQCCRRSTTAGHIVTRAVDLVHSVYQEGLVDPALALGFLLGLVLTRDAAGDPSEDKKRLEIVYSVGQALGHMGDGELVLELVGNQLEKALAARQETEVVDSVVRLVSGLLRISMIGRKGFGGRKLPGSLGAVMPEALGRQLIHFVEIKESPAPSTAPHAASSILSSLTVLLHSQELILPTFEWITDFAVSQNENFLLSIKALECMFSIKAFLAPLSKLESTVEQSFKKLKGFVEGQTTETERSSFKKAYRDFFTLVSLVFGWQKDELRVAL